MGWDNVGSNSASSKKSSYYKIKQGMNKIRIIDDEPVTRWVHFIKGGNGGTGISITCIGKKDCPCCHIDAKAKELDKNAKLPYGSSKKHTINIVDRTNGEVSILEEGNTMFESLILGYASAKDAFKETHPNLKITDFDFQIMVGMKDGKKTYNSVPMLPVPFTDVVEKFDLVKATKSHDPETIKEILTLKPFSEIFKNDTEDIKTEVDFTIVD